MHKDLGPENGANAERRQDADMIERKLAAIRRFFGDEAAERLSQRMKAGEPSKLELFFLLTEGGLDLVARELGLHTVAQELRRMSAKDFGLLLFVAVCIRQVATVRAGA